VRPFLTATGASRTERDARTVLEIPYEIRADIIRRVAGMAPDIVVLGGVGLLRLAETLADHAGRNNIRLIADCHNVESLLLAEIDRAKLSVPIRFLAPIVFRRRWRLARSADRDFARQMSEIWVCSEDDRARLSQIADRQTPIAVVPNPVPGWCSESENEFPERFAGPQLKALFVGHLRYRPNVVAVRRLAGAIWPQIEKRLPGAQLTICGRSPGGRLRRQVAPIRNIRLIADPVDLRPLYEDADAAILPLSEGGGSRIKVLEALAAGLPVIATRKAVEGLALESDRHFVAAEKPAEFVAAFERLRTDPALRHRLIAEGRRFVSERHTQSAIDRTVTAALTAMVPGKCNRDSHGLLP
jgi:glycosyltransferase involved in cell wall biosynthesis